MTGEAQEVPINQPTPTGEILNDLTIGEYDVVITSVPHRETLEDSQFEQAVALRELGIALPDSVLIDASRLMNKKEIVRAMEGDQNSPRRRQSANAWHARQRLKPWRPRPRLPRWLQMQDSSRPVPAKWLSRPNSWRRVGARAALIPVSRTWPVWSWMRPRRTLRSPSSRLSSSTAVRWTSCGLVKSADATMTKCRRVLHRRSSSVQTVRMNYAHKRRRPHRKPRRVNL